MNPKLLRYYKKKMHGGRSVVARTVDFIMFRIFLLIFIFITVLYLSLSTTVALLISIFLTVAISLLIYAINRKKVEKFILSDLKKLKQKCLLEKLTIMNADEYINYINTMLGGTIIDIEQTHDGFYGKSDKNNIYIFQNHPSTECGVSEVLNVYRSLGSEKNIVIMSLSEFSAEAINMCSILPVKVYTVGGKKILDLAEKANMLPDEEEAEQNAVKEMNEAVVTLEEVKNAAFGKTKIKSYIICGIVIMCWPLVSGFRIYYPIIAIACFTLAGISYKLSKRNKKESSDIGIS